MTTGSPEWSQHTERIDTEKGKGLTRHEVDLVLDLEVLEDGDLLGAVIRIREASLRGIQRGELIDGPLDLLTLQVSGGDADTLECAKVLLEVGVLPVGAGGVEALDELWRITVEDLADSASELLGAPEGAVGDVDVDRERLAEVLIEDRAKRGEDALEGLNAATKIEALLAALEERLLDLGVLLRRPLTHDVVQEVDDVDALRGPGDVTLQEGVEVVEVDLTSMTEVDRVLVAALAGLGRTTLFLVKVTGDAELIAEIVS